MKQLRSRAGGYVLPGGTQVPASGARSAETFAQHRRVRVNSCPRRSMLGKAGFGMPDLLENRCAATRRPPGLWNRRVEPGFTICRLEGIVMITRTNRLASRFRLLIAGSVVATALVVPLSLSTPEAGALGTSPFCTALFSWAEHQPPAPTALSLSGYHAWAKALAPYYERMAAVAPNAKTKTVLNDIVVVLKAYASYSSLKKLAAYESAHHAAFEADVKSLAAAIKACA